MFLQFCLLFLMPVVRAQAITADVTYPMAPFQLGFAAATPISGTDTLLYRPTGPSTGKIERLGPDLLARWSTEVSFPDAAQENKRAPAVFGPDYEGVSGTTLTELRSADTEARVVQSTVDSVFLDRVNLDTGAVTMETLVPRGSPGSTAVLVAAPNFRPLVVLVFPDHGPGGMAWFFDKRLKLTGTVDLDLAEKDRAHTVAAMDPSGALLLTTVVSPRSLQLTRLAPAQDTLHGSYQLATGRISTVRLAFGKDGTGWVGVFEDKVVDAATVARAVFGIPSELAAIHVLAVPRGHAAPEALARHTADTLFEGVAGMRVDHQMLGSLTPLDAGGVAMVTQFHDLRHYTDRSGISHPYEVWGRAEVLGFGSNSAFLFHRSIPATPDSYGVSWSPVAPVSIGQVAGRLRVLYTASPGANRENKIFVEPSTISVLLDEFTPNGEAPAPRVLATLGQYGSLQSNLAASFGTDALVFGAREGGGFNGGFQWMSGAVDVRMRRVDLTPAPSDATAPTMVQDAERDPRGSE